jgi:hypothetical protein
MCTVCIDEPTAEIDVYNCGTCRFFCNEDISLPAEVGRCAKGSKPADFL